MTKPILSVKAVGNTKESSRTLYKVQIAMSNGRNFVVEKSIDQYVLLEKQISARCFDFEKIFQKNMHNCKTPEKTMELIIEFMNICKQRKDICNLQVFQQFCSIEGTPGLVTSSDVICEWNRINVSIPDMKLIDFVWSPQQQLLITLHKPENTKKIKNFFKQLLAKQTKSGIVQFCSQIPKWEKLHELSTQAEPRIIKYYDKSGLLFIGTEIGIYVYTVVFEGKKIQVQVLDFIKVYNVKVFEYAPKSALVYYANGNTLYVHSISKQLTLQVFRNENQISSLVLSSNEERLYCSQSDNLHILDISNWKQSSHIHTIGNQQPFSKIIITNTHLFCLCDAGLIGVVELRADKKEKLMSFLTNIDVPEKSAVFEYIQQKHMFIMSYYNNLVLISSKSQPIFSGGFNHKKIVSGMVAQMSKQIVIADQSGDIVFYNVNFNQQIFKQ